MRRSLSLLATLPLLMFCGCLAIGNGGQDQPTMADEIRELEELRQEGRISPVQYQTGVNTLLHSPRMPVVTQ